MCNSVLHSTAVQESPTVTVNKEADQHVQQCFTFYSSPGISNCHCQQRDRSACATVFYVLQQSRNLQLSLSTKRQISMCNSVLHSTAVQESPTVTVNKETDQHVEQCFTFYSSPGISATLIDHVYTSQPDKVTECFVPNLALSDLYPVCFTRQTTKLQSTKRSHSSIKY